MLPNTMLVISPRRVTVLLFVATQGIVVGIDMKLWNQVGNYFDKSLAKVNVENHMQCLVKCLVNTKCRSYMSKAVPGSPLSDIRCFIDESLPGSKMKFAMKAYACDKVMGPRETIPQVIVGVCSHHKCTSGTICMPRRNDTGHYCRHLNWRRLNRPG